jgi:hypothetical protein
VRDQTEERKEMHRRINRLRDKTEERKQYKQDLHTRNFLKSVASDTGFNVICACCSEYKSRYTCTGIQVLTVSQQRKFLINKKLVISKDGQRYICKVCRSHIKEGKIPTKSEKQQWKYANIPTYLKKTLTKVTSYSKVIKKRKLSKEVNNIDRALELNKLEAHLLKLIIPFVRIAHCPRGTYFKVRGNLILISADVTHSLSRILPLSQNIIPVCFKRKLEYTGNYLEEVIDKNKVQAYFDFYKMNNPLYEDIVLKEDSIDQFVTECNEYADKFKTATEKLEAISPTKEDNLTSDSESDTDGPEFMSDFEVLEEIDKDEESDKTHFFRDQSTVFCNKYEEDVMVPAVANKLANIIVAVEINNVIDSELYKPDKSDINDEINLEEVNQFLDDLENNDDDIYRSQNSSNLAELEDEFDEEAENNLVNEMKKTSRDQFHKTISRLEKVAVAPGEKGKFQNWGEDIFLEEKAFPELFPFGVGGYLSAAVDETQEKMGFAQYIKHRVLSADSKYRRNSAYIFFLLLVKELVQLKRCKQTYLRQATKAPNLTKESMINVNAENLSRYNRSYQVFKTMRGTNMYYEDAKKNVMAVLRQKGSPSLFVTLSCAEYSWKGLLKEIMETVKGRKVTEKKIDELTISQRNKLISENVIQSTLHFQKRIEKELRLMTYENFFDDNCPYSVSSYFYRVEFQQRGAPHVHCLLWLEDNRGNPAPTFWNCESEEKNNKADMKEKIRKIEDIAEMLISGCAEEAMCDEHYRDLQNILTEKGAKECRECFSVKHDFERCPVHIINNFTVNDCQKCEAYKLLVKDFQTHNHTFTCKKKRKTIAVRKQDGHGRLDGKPHNC